MTWGWAEPGTVSLDEARRTSAVSLCVKAIAKAFPEARPEVARLQSDGDPEVIPDHPLVALLRRPNPDMGEYMLAYQLMVDLNVWGTAYWLKVRNASGQVIQLRRLNPEHVTADPGGDPAVFIEQYRYTPNGDELTYPSTDVVRFAMGVDPDMPLYGLSPLKTILREITTDREATRFQSSVLRNFGMPGVVVSASGVTEREAELFKSRWEEHFTGENRGRIGVIDGDKMTVREVGWEPAKLQLDVAHRNPEERISGEFGVPAIIAGFGAGLDRATYSNFREAREMFTESTMMGLWRLVADQVNLQLLPEFSGNDASLVFRYDLGEVRAFQEDETARWDRARGALIGGAFTVNDFLREIGKPEVPDGNIYLQQISTIAVPAGERAAANLALLEAEAGQSVERNAPKGAKGLNRAQRLAHQLRLLQVSSLPASRAVVQRAFDSIARDIDQRLKSSDADGAKGAAEDLWPDDAPERLATSILQVYHAQAGLTWQILNDFFGAGVEWNETDPRVRALLLDAGVRVRGISDATLAGLRTILSENADLPRRQLRARIRAVVQETYAGRAEAIARTELRMATNQASAIRYIDAGVQQVDVIDGDEDEPCRSRNGQRVGIDVFQRWDNEEHPNGTLSAIPVLEAVSSEARA